MAPPDNIKVILGELASRVAIDPELLRHLEKTFLSEERDRFTVILYNLLPKKHHHLVKDVWSLFIGYCK